MPNILEEQAKQRIQRARAFLEKAHALMLQDDLVYRSALDDAVSAIKNDLQGFLLLKAASMAPSALRQEWQEVALGNRMPDLLRSCSEAGLDLRSLSSEIRRLNDERNSRTHDDPLRRVDTAQARQAVDLALLLHRRIQEAQRASGARMPVPSVALSSQLPAAELAKVGIGRAPVAAGSRAGAAVLGSNGSAPAAAASAARGGVAIATAPGEASSTAKGAPSPAASGAAPEKGAVASSQAEDAQAAQTTLGEDREGDTAEHAAVEGAVRRRWVRRVLVRGGAIAALLLLGVGAGIGGTLFAGGLPLGRASTPTFQPGATATAAAAATASATLPGNVLLAAGSLLVGAPVCQAGRTEVTLRNIGATPLSFSAGSPDASAVTFTLAPETPGQPTASGSLAPSATATLYIAGAPTGSHYHIVVVGQNGTVQLPGVGC